MNLPTPASVAELAARLGADWPAIRAAALKAEMERRELEEIVSPFLNDDLSFVVFGSIARGESTVGSDLDWALLVDGQARRSHLDTMLELGRRVAVRFPPPGPEGVFGCFMFSHDLVHFIGGEDDDNINTTRRLLLVLESQAIGRQEAYERTLNEVLVRYVAEDASVTLSDPLRRVPRFLQNDIARYWRTIAVDFAYKRRTRGEEGWALRTAKLRMSRKMLYASGLAMCFLVALDTDTAQGGTIADPEATSRHMVSALADFVRTPPLTVLAHLMLRYSILNEPAARLFSSYDRFLEILDDPSKRDQLKSLNRQAALNDQLYQEVGSLCSEFQYALTEIFQGEGTELANFTKRYGVF